MNKIKLFLIASAIFLTINVKAQVSISKQDSVFIFNNKANNIVGISTNGLLTEEALLEYYSFKYGRFVTKKIVLGTELGRSWYGNWERTTHLGLNMRYYLAVFKRFSYFSEAKYLHGFKNYYNEITLSEWNGQTNNYTVNLGVAFNNLFKKRIGFEFFTGYTFNTLFIEKHPTLNEFYWSKSDFDYGFQINFYF